MLPAPTTLASLGIMYFIASLEISYKLCFMLVGMSIVQGG
jgi:hypothetical protein